jgi:radical SAM superfamily enzyme YgiQ (UPF0313 family)
MNVLIVNTNRHNQPFPVMPLGACMVAGAVERAGHRVQMLDFMFEADPISALRRKLTGCRFDIVGLSIRNIDNNDMRSPKFFIEGLPDLVHTIRELSEARIVIGGAAIGVMPEEILRFSGADYAVLGDGEYVMPELLSRIENGDGVKTPGLACISDGVFHSTPRSAAAFSGSCMLPDFSRWIDVRAYMSRMSTVPLQTKLGCRYKCVYCTYRKIEGEAYRLCSPECVVETVQKLSSAGLKDIEFVDNVFNSPYEHAMEICRLLKTRKHGARLQSLELNPTFIDDALIDAMEEAGFVGIGITAESASDNVLRRVRKPFTLQDIHNAASVIKRHRIPCIWIFLLGCPGESRQTVEETFAFAERYVRPRDAVFFNIGVRVYPGTELETIAREQEQLDLPPHEMLRPVFYLSPDIEPEWLSRRTDEFLKTHMNAIDSTSLWLPFLPILHKIGHRMGLKPPLWKHTPAIRRFLQYTGIYTYRGQ